MHVLQVASVVGPILPYSVLAKVSGTNGQLPAQLRDLQRLDFLRETRRRPDTEYVSSTRLSATSPTAPC
jgi:hypothetical protein